MPALATPYQGVQWHIDLVSVHSGNLYKAGRDMCPVTIICQSIMQYICCLYYYDCYDCYDYYYYYY